MVSSRPHIWHGWITSGRVNTAKELTFKDKAAASSAVAVQNNVMGGNKGVVVNGQPAMTTSQHEKWKHMKRHDIIHVAPGMDILLALGVSWITSDKAKQDGKAVVEAAAC
jgi:hypothetical protein